MHKYFLIPETLIIAMLAGASASIHAEQIKAAESEKPQSPWLATPLISSDPKLGTTLGAMAGYLHQFDAASPTSMFAVMGKYSDTDSYIAGVFGQMYFNQDQQRLLVATALGYVKNDYDYEGERNDFIKQREHSNYLQIHFSGSGSQGPGKYTFACSTPDEEVQGIVETIVD